MPGKISLEVNFKFILTQSFLQACNGNNFIKVSQSTMNALAISSQSKFKQGPPDFYEDEATGFSSEEDCADYYDDVPPPAPSRSRKWELCKCYVSISQVVRACFPV